MTAFQQMILLVEQIQACCLRLHRRLNQVASTPVGESSNLHRQLRSWWSVTDADSEDGAPAGEALIRGRRAGRVPGSGGGAGSDSPASRCMSSARASADMRRPPPSSAGQQQAKLCEPTVGSDAQQSWSSACPESDEKRSGSASRRLGCGTSNSAQGRTSCQAKRQCSRPHTCGTSGAKQSHMPFRRAPTESGG